MGRTESLVHTPEQQVAVKHLICWLPSAVNKNKKKKKKEAVEKLICVTTFVRVGLFFCFLFLTLSHIWFSFLERFIYTCFNMTLIPSVRTLSQPPASYSQVCLRVNS